MCMKRSLVIALIIIAILPAFINFAMLQPSFFPYVGEVKDWLGFWGDYLSAAVAAIMIIYTAYSLRLNERTLNEMKREWEEDRKARLVISITSNDWIFMIRVKNIGKLPAYNIRMGFNKDFVNSLFAEKIRLTYTNLMNKRFSLDAGESKYFYLSPIYNHHMDAYKIGDETIHSREIKNWLDEFQHKSIIVEAYYNDKEFCYYETTLEDYLISDLTIKDDIAQQLTNIAQGTVKNNSQYYPIQKSLDIIAKYVEKQK